LLIAEIVLSTDMAKQTIIYVKCCADWLIYLIVFFYLLRLFNFCSLFFHLCCATTYDGEIKLYILFVSEFFSTGHTPQLSLVPRRGDFLMSVCFLEFLKRKREFNYHILRDIVINVIFRMFLLQKLQTLYNPSK